MLALGIKGIGIGGEVEKFFSLWPPYFLEFGADSLIYNNTNISLTTLQFTGNVRQ